MKYLVRNTCLALALAFAVPAFAADSVNINAADADTLASSISGVGIEKARLIVAYRDAYGPFKSVDDLAQVKGIGSKTIEKNRSVLSVSGK